MKPLKIIAVLLLVLAGTFVAGGFLLPASTHVERSIVIDRPPADVHAMLDSYRRFNEWSPWAGADPDARYDYSGPERGVGAMLSWRGDPNTVGTGSQRIVESVPPRRVATELDFGQMGKARAVFTIEPVGAGSRVTWAFDTDHAGMDDRWFGLLLDPMVGGDFEKGLAKLKAVMEAGPR